MHWGHTIGFGEGKREVTREEYNAGFGVPTPECPEIPDQGRFVFSLFWDLNKKRRPSEGGTFPLLPTDIEGHLRLSGEAIDEYDYKLIGAMDDAYISEVGKERKARME